MIMTPGAIYRNLDNWNYSTLGPYKVDQMQGEAMKQALALMVKKGMVVEEGDLQKGVPTTYHCPLCGKKVEPEWICCPNCGKWIIKKQEKKNEENDDGVQGVRRENEMG